MTVTTSVVSPAHEVVRRDLDIIRHLDGAGFHAVDGAATDS
ncbi:hypothetical protein AAH978_06630 [Streptomyces sp. ZYX-F-203]